jgi:hypothetical protein
MKKLKISEDMARDIEIPVSLFQIEKQKEKTPSGASSHLQFNNFSQNIQMLQVRESQVFQSGSTTTKNNKKPPLGIMSQTS